MSNLFPIFVISYKALMNMFEVFTCQLVNENVEEQILKKFSNPFRAFGDYFVRMSVYGFDYAYIAITIKGKTIKLHKTNNYED